MTSCKFNKNRTIKSTLRFAGVLMLAEHVFAIINAYFIHSVDIYTLYAFVIVAIYVPGCFLIYYLSISASKSNQYDFFYNAKNLKIINNAGKVLLLISSIVLINSIIYFITMAGAPDIRDILLSNSRFGDSQLLASLVPALTSLAFIGMLWSSVVGNANSMKTMTLAFVLLEASTLSRSGFIGVLFCVLVYFYRIRLPIKQYIPSFFILLGIMSAVGLAQGRFDPESIMKILLAPVLSLSRYYAEAFALPYSITEAARSIPSLAVIFGFPMIKLYTLLGDGGSMYFYDIFRTEFFPVDIGGASEYSNVIHSFPSLLLATGGVPVFFIGLVVWLLFTFAAFKYSPPLGFIFFYLIFFRGLFGYNLMGWHYFIAIMMVVLLTKRPKKTLTGCT